MEEYGSSLIPIIMPKLPNEVHLRIARDSKDGKRGWKLETIKVEEAKEASNMNKATVKPLVHPKPPSSSSALFTSNQVPKCVYCEEEHYSSSCQVVKDIK